MFLRLLALAAIAYGLGWPQVPKNDNTTSKSKAANTKTDSKPVEPTHVIIDTPISGTINTQTPSQNSQSKPEQPIPWWRELLKPEWLIVYVTTAYTILAGLQWLAIRRQANLLAEQIKEAKGSSESTAATAASTLAAIQRQAAAMESQLQEMTAATIHAGSHAEAAIRSADAAKLNADVLINSERAWVIISNVYEPDLQLSTLPGTVLPANHFRFDLVNKGKTVARLMEFQGASGLLTRTERLPDVPGYPPLTRKAGIGVHHAAVLVPEESLKNITIEIHERIDDATLMEIRNFDRALYVYGVLRYLDFAEKERQLQFCYRYIPAGIRLHAESDKGLELLARWMLAGPPDYNTHK